MSAEPAAVAWTYWENQPGKQRSAYLDLCLETIGRHAPPLELRCLSRDDTPEVLPDLDVERWHALPAPNYRSDYVRSRLLERYGGVWIDIDTIAVAPLSRLLDELDDTGTVCFGREVGRFFGGLCAAAPGSAFMTRWAGEQDRALDRSKDWSTLGYAALAQDVTWHIARDTPWKALPTERVAPVPWFQWRRFFSRLESPKHLLSGDPITVVLWNAVMAPTLRPMDHDALMRSRMLVCRLLRIGLGRSTVEQEEGPLTTLHALSEARFSKRGQGVELALRRLHRRLRRGGR